LDQQEHQAGPHRPAEAEVPAVPASVGAAVCPQAGEVPGLRIAVLEQETEECMKHVLAAIAQLDREIRQIARDIAQKQARSRGTTILKNTPTA